MEVFLMTGTKEKVGVVFSNLGTPKSPNPEDVGRYLGEFLMDHHVIQIPYFVRLLLVRGIIVPFRKKKSAKNYQKVWTEQGSPLLVETEKAAQALQDSLGEGFQVEVGMRYGEPSFAQVKERLKDCKKIIFFPQYPQYAASTVQTGLDHFFRYFDREKTRVVPPYYEHPAFLKAYGLFLKEQLKGKEDHHLLMSFHGLPETHLTKGDPSGSHCLQVEKCCEKAQGAVLNKCYRAQCYRSAHGIAREIGLQPEDYSVSFQSRLGRQKWIEPYTEDMYGELVKRGKKKLVVICPGFPVDGLETLEEIALEGRQSYLEAGGESFEFVPCLNDHPAWIQACVDLVQGR
jgi:ferrochelatase